MKWEKDTTTVSDRGILTLNPSVFRQNAQTNDHFEEFHIKHDYFPPLVHVCLVCLVLMSSVRKFKANIENLNFKGQSWLMTAGVSLGLTSKLMEQQSSQTPPAP